MSALPAIGFLFPLALAGLLALPVIWWLLRFTPPRPRRETFPPTRILAELMKRDETRAKSPLWLTLLRMLIAALAILAMAGPVLNPNVAEIRTDGPLVLIVDTGWSSAPHRDAMRATAENAIAAAQGAGQPVILAPTAPAEPGGNVGPYDADEARERLAGMVAQPVPARRSDLVALIRTALAGETPGSVLWLSDGVSDASIDAFTENLATLAAGAPVTVFLPETSDLPLTLDLPVNSASTLDIYVRAAQAAGGRGGTVRAHDLKGNVIAETPFSFAPGADIAETQIELPVELRNEIARLEIADAETAASVHLLDERWRRRTVGLITGAARQHAQTLLSPLFYISRALQPFADLREPRQATLAEDVEDLIEQRVSVITLADVGALAGAEESLTQWVDDGGILLRFAGPRLAASADELIPVNLRRGERNLGGTLSWSEPQKLAEFNENGPFTGLQVPADVTVSRQVLAEPSIALADATWAQLADGTPLVTARKQGRGWIVLFHITADTAWSNLPLSGVFVDMLRRVTALGTASGDGQTSEADAVAEAAEQTGPVLRPFRLLDGKGRLSAPTLYSEPIASRAIANTQPTREHPPGLYGSDDGFRALNLVAGDAYSPIADLPDALTRGVYVTANPTNLTPWLLAAALIFLVADTIAILLLTGRRPSLLRARGALILAFTILPLASPSQVRAQERDPQADTFALQASLVTRLAYVETGNRALDDTTRAGLAGLTAQLTRRTALEPGSPIAVNISRDELAFFPLLYWAIDPGMSAPEPDVINRLNAYLKNGGTILFDTRDSLAGAADLSGASGGQAWMRRVLGDLDIPELEPVPADHVITKAFYLLQEFPGRFNSGPMWVEVTERDPDAPPRPAGNADGVSAVLITPNDFAGAWATQDETGQPMFPMSSGSEWQREIAYRVGINIVMYTLTGNYKADQVHIPALLERLGQ